MAKLPLRLRALPLQFALGVMLLASAAAASKHDPSVVELVEWFTARKGAYFNPKQEIRRAGDAAAELGVFATERIKKGELLVSVPWNITINAGKEMPDPPPLVCETVHNLIREMRLGEKSEFAPYVTYLIKQREGKVPSSWSDAGKALLNDVLGTDPWGGDGPIPPTEPFEWITVDWRRHCDGSNDPFEENAAMLVLQRAEDDLMLPIFDMYQHRNGDYFNTEDSRVEGVKFDLMASRDIEKGEQIHNSLNMCTDCGGRQSGYGTPEILRDYGFVEQLPQRWVFHDQSVAFDVQEKTTVPGELEVVWAVNTQPKGKAGKKFAAFLRDQIHRLERMQKVEQADEKVPDHEWITTWEYVDSLLVSMELAVKDILGENEVCVGEEVDGTCMVSYGYDALEDEQDDMYYEEKDRQYLKPVTCNNKKFMKFKDYEEDEVIKSIYQTFTFVSNPEIDDVCFDIEDIVQICANYRPHYHEFNMDFAARYVKDVRRVIFIGGGDSMLLYEALKYPSLELVVGLELDQKVVRKSFKYFHTQPHFDDDRVEWWFGDATKSLLMLPKDYFGSFDLVLVDLSETVMSFPVLEKLDVLQALALLLKPDGVMVKNELYLEPMSSIFDYTAQIYVPDVPSICDQILVMGSNKVDFLTHSVKDHHVNTLLLAPLDQIEDRFHLFHDYRKNDARSQGKCDIDKDPMDELDRLQRHAGILLVADVEGTTVPLQPLSGIAQSIFGSLQKEGLSPLSTIAPSSDDDGVVVVIPMSEGYVVARTWPEHKYCALDLNLWGGFDKMGRVRDALVAVLGGSSTSMSSYKIVVGGMRGTVTWKEDQKMIGPRITQTRNCSEDTKEYGLLNDQKSVDIALEETLSLLQRKDIEAAVLCGVESKSCKSLDVLAKNDNVRDVITLWTCPDIADDPQFLQGGEERMIECERDTTTALRKAVADRKEIGLFVVDASAPVAMVKIAYSILNAQRNQDGLLMEDIVFIALMPEQSETWRKKHNFLDKMRKSLYYDPLFAAELVLTSAEGNKTEIGVLSSEDPDFFRHLDGAASAIKQRSKLDVEVRKIQGAMITDQKEFNPEPSFKLGDYDIRDAKEQFANQKSFGRQSIFQLDIHNQANKLSSALVKSLLEYTVSEMEYSIMEMKEFTDVGDGSVVIAIFEEGSAIVVWDGSAHVDINLFTYNENEELATQFVDLFKGRFPGKFLNLSLRDEQPRGIGRVVNFREDMK